MTINDRGAARAESAAANIDPSGARVSVQRRHRAAGDERGRCQDSARPLRSPRPSEPASAGPAQGPSGCGPVVAQEPIELIGPLFREEQPSTLQLDRRLCSGDRLGEPMRPFHREVDVIRGPGN
jgi:hypothetical protein